MSWREILGVSPATEAPYPHNSQNASKPPEPSDSADFADSAHRDSEQENFQLMEALAKACKGLNITPAEVKQALAAEDIDDWCNGDITSDTLAAFARSLVQRREMDQGTRPAHYTERANCRQCGPIWLWYAGEVLGCPWCWNRAADRPIPRPDTLR